MGKARPEKRERDAAKLARAEEREIVMDETKIDFSKLSGDALTTMQDQIDTELDTRASTLLNQLTESLDRLSDEELESLKEAVEAEEHAREEEPEE